MVCMCIVQTTYIFSVRFFSPTSTTSRCCKFNSENSRGFRCVLFPHCSKLSLCSHSAIVLFFFHAVTCKMMGMREKWMITFTLQSCCWFTWLEIPHTYSEMHSTSVKNAFQMHRIISVAAVIYLKKKGGHDDGDLCTLHFLSPTETIKICANQKLPVTVANG